MKNLKMILAVAATASLTVACNKNFQTVEPIEPSGSSVLNFSLAGIDALTKASSVTSQGKETIVSDVQILLFDSDNKVAVYLDNGTLTTGSISVKQGTYTLAALVNGPDVSGVNTYDELHSVSVPLSEYNSTSTDFVMFGKESGVEVLKNQSNSKTVTVERLVSRARLASVSNKCPVGLGVLTLKRVFLSNIVCNRNVGGDSAASLWSNKFGRSDISNSSTIIDGSSYKAEPEDLTFADLEENAIAVGNTSDQLAFLYSYPNPESDNVKTYTGVWTPTATRLVIVAELDGTDYYYPVALPATKANYSYDVSVSIYGKGLSDPQGDISDLADKGTANVQVSIKDWISGNEYNVEY